MRSLPGRLAGLSLAVLLSGCGQEPLFPAEYRDTFVEVRDCRQSGDHDLHNIRVLADPAALAPYMDRSAPFPIGATIVKEEYDFGDTDCAGPIVRWTVMQRVAAGEAPALLDWDWQDVDADRSVSDESPQRCANCHQGCVPPDGYEGTCTVP